MDIKELEGLDELFNLISDTISHQAYDKKPLGTVSETLRLRFMAMKKDKEYITRELDMRKATLTAEMELQLYKEFTERIESNSDLKDALWVDATKELGLPEDGSYSINHKTGILSEKIKKENQNKFDELSKKRRW